MFAERNFNQNKWTFFSSPPVCRNVRAKRVFFQPRKNAKGLVFPGLLPLKYIVKWWLFLRRFGETDLGDEYWQRFCHFSTYLITSYCYFHFICMFTKVYQNNPYPYWCYSLENVWIRMNVFTRDKFERFRMHRQKYMKMFTFTHTFSTFVAMNTIQV